MQQLLYENTHLFRLEEILLAEREENRFRVAGFVKNRQEDRFGLKSVTFQANQQKPGLAKSRQSTSQNQ